MTAERILEKKGHRVLSVDEGVTLKAVIAELARHRVGVLLITNASGDTIGIISERDVIAILAEDPDAMQRTAASMMTGLLVKCSLDDSEADMMSRMAKARVRHRLPETKRAAPGGRSPLVDIATTISRRGRRGP